MRRLNVGCGPDLHDGWVNVDPKVWGMWQDVAGDVFALPFADGSFDGAVANHVLQMLPQHRIVDALREIHRVLAPDGVARLLVPALAAAILAWERNEWTWFPNQGATLDERFATYLSQNGATRSFFTSSLLKKYCHCAGFGQVFAQSYGSTIETGLAVLDSRRSESIIVEAVK